MAENPREADPDQTSDLPAPRERKLATAPVEDPTTFRRADTSITQDRRDQTGEYHSDSGPIPPYETATFDPSRTGAYQPSEDGAGWAATPPGYEVLGELGRGGMGVVYKARQVALDRVVALKMILAGPHASTAAVARFRAEAQAVARFQHPNIVQIHEVGDHGGLPYFSLEYVAGGPLSKKIAREPQPPRYAAETVERLARAVQYAHERGIIHRDLKPANVLLGEDGTPKLTDFGLAKRLEDESGQTHTGQILGTPSYMAPEQASGDVEKVGPVADVYALGAILYDLLTGRPPFAGSSVLDTLEMVRTREPVSPSQLAGKVPRDLETICLKCLQKESQRRYATAGELADDLRRFLDGRPIVARPVSAIERGWRWAKRNPVGAGFLALLATTAIVTSVLSWQLSIQKAEAEEQTRQANIAKDNETIAKNSAVKSQGYAIERQDIAMDVIRGVMLHVDEKMRNQRTLAPIRKQILTASLKDLERIRDTAVEHPLGDRSDAVAHQRLGDVYMKLYQVSEAGVEFQRAYDILDKRVKDNPNDSVNLRNLAGITNLMGDVELRVPGDATKTRDRYAAALTLRQRALVLLPDSEATQESVAQSHSLLGKISYLLGEPDAAIKHYQQSDAVYAEFASKKNNPIYIRRERASIKDWLGHCCLALGRIADAETQYKSALADREANIGEARKDGKRPSPILVRDLSFSWIALGDLALIQGKLTQAWAAYGRVYDVFAAQLKPDPDNLIAARDMAMIHYRVGVTSERLAETVGSVAGTAALHGLAARHYADCLRLRTGLAAIDDKDAQGQIELMLALARVGRAAEAEKIADGLQASIGDDRRILFQIACGYSIASGVPGEVGNSCRNKSITVLNTLIGRGWKARGSLETDPDLELVRRDKQFPQLIAKLNP